MTELVWQDPPSRRASSARWAKVVEELRANPGAWALVAEDEPASTASNIKRGAIKAFSPAGAFEATTRKGATRCNIYARFVGGEQ